MRIFPPSVEISPEEGFDPAKDIFNRAPMGQGLTNLLGTTQDPLVLALNGPWGTGKSTFLLMWAGELRKAGFPVIYFDAFAHDYLEDAFEALAGEIVDLASGNLKPAASKRIKDVAVSAGKVLIKVGASVGVRAATAGILNAKDLSDIADDAKDAVGNAADKIIEDALATRKKQRETLDTFRKTLSDLPKLLGKGDKPLVFIIDELDRCKPPFALAILERVKHFFAVRNIHFVFGVHMRQLENSVTITYGSGIDAHLYLQKFISLTVSLDTPSDHRNESDVFKYLNYLRTRMEFSQDDDLETLQYTSELIAEFSRYRDIKLRALEKIMSTLAIALAYTGKNFMKIPPIIAGLCVMKVIAPELFLKAQRGTLTFDEASAFFDLHKEADDGGTGWPSEFFTQWWQYALDPNAPPDLISALNQATLRYSVRNRGKIVPITANQVIDRFARGGAAN